MADDVKRHPSMQPIDDNHLPAELLEELRARGWRVAVGGFDSVLLDEADRSAARAREAFNAGVGRLEWGASASAVLCAAAACESRLSEYLVHWEFASGDLPPELAGIRSETNALSQWRTLLAHQSPEFDKAPAMSICGLGVSSGLATWWPIATRGGG